MAYVGKNPNFNTTILDNQGAGGVSNAPTGKVKLINRDGQILTKDDAGNESTLGGGGLEVVYETGPTFTAEAGKHYRCTSAVTGVTMPEITADIAQIAFSPSEGAEWSTNAITVTPHSSQYIDRDNGSVADETFKLNMSGVDTVTMTSKFSTLNWEVDTPITPSNIGNGAIVTAWQPYTPTNTQGFGVITSVALEWRQVGQNVEVRGSFAPGTTTAVEAQIELPNSYTIAQDDSGTVIAGHAIRSLTSTLPYHYRVLTTNGDTYVNFGYREGTQNVQPFDPINGSTAAGAGKFAIEFSVPVVEFGSGTTTLTASDFSAKTEWVDNTVLNVTETSSNGLSVTTVKGRAHRDSKGQYSFEFQFEGTKNNNTSGVNFSMNGISADFNQKIHGRDDNGASEFVAGTDTFNVAGPTSATGATQSGGTILLDAKPSWFDANAEASFDMDLHFQEATPTVLGLVKSNKWQKIAISGSSSNTPGANVAQFNNLVIGKVYRITFAMNRQAGPTSFRTHIYPGSLGTTSYKTSDYGTVDSGDVGDYYKEYAVFTASSAVAIVAAQHNSGSAGSVTGFAWIEELNNYEPETTDFT